MTKSRADKGGSSNVAKMNETSKSKQQLLSAPLLSSSTILLTCTLCLLAPAPKVILALPAAPLINNPMQQQLQSLQQQSILLNSINNNPFTRAANDILIDLRQQMLTRNFKFDEQFQSLLKNSRMTLHQMFEGTYGILYQRNTEIFTSMFDSLALYYSNGSIQLHQSMQNFFDELYQKIFQVLNASREYNQDYLKCATEQMSKLKPFKDVPEKLIDDIIRAFVSARTFHQALNRGIDVIRKVISIGQTPVCANLINDKLLANHGQPICLNYCEQIVTKCVGKESLEKLNENWRAYVIAMDELAFRLANKYNFEAIISPLDVKISEAIMNFQENGDNITYQVSLICGQQTSAQQHHGPIMAASTAISSASPSVHHHLRPTTNNNRIRKRATLIAQGGLSAGPFQQRSGQQLSSQRAANMNSPDDYNYNQRQSNLQPRTFTASGISASSPSSIPSISGRYYDVGAYNSRSSQLQQQQHIRSQPVNGQPMMNGHRSSSLSSPIPMASTQFGDNGPTSQDHSTALRGPELGSMQKRGFKSSTLVDEIRAYMSKTKNFWSTFPNAVCISNYANNQSKPLVIAGPNNKNNLNGTIASNNNNKRTQQQQQSCYEEPITQLGDINNQDYRHKIEISQAVNLLADIRAKIMIALDGKEVEWGPPGMSVKFPQVTLPNQIAATSISTTSTTHSPALLSSSGSSSSSSIDDDDSESDPGDDGIDDEEGSGLGPDNYMDNSDEDSAYGSDGSTNLDDTTTNQSVDDIDSQDQTQTSSSSSSSLSETSTSIPLDNSIDRLSADQAANPAANPPPLRGLSGNDINDNFNNNDRFIVPPDAQKSSQTSAKLVISNSFNVMLLCSVLSTSSYILHNLIPLITQRGNHDRIR